MLNWFRRHASRIAATAIVSLTAVGGSALTPHQDDCHDAECPAVAVEHNAAAHRIAAPPRGTDAHPLHCLVCHFVQSFRPRPESKILSTPAIEAGIAIHVELFTAARRTQVAQPPLRSPPLAPVVS